MNKIVVCEVAMVGGGRTGEEEGAVGVAANTATGWSASIEVSKAESVVGYLLSDHEISYMHGCRAWTRAVGVKGAAT